MKRKKLAYLMAGAVMISAAVLNSGQHSESYMQQFQRNLMDSFIGPMNAERKEVTPRHRAMFMGYILNRQAGRIGEFDMDKIRMKDLVSEVKEFLQAVSSGEDLWPIVEAGMRGEYTQEVDTMLGGPVYVEPIFPTLDDMVGDWNDWDYSSNRLYDYPDHKAVLNVAQNFLQHVKAKRYQEALKLTGGRLFENFSQWLSGDPSPQDEMNQYFENLEWKAGMAGMADTDPPIVKIIFALRDLEGDWDDDPCILILDYGVWKIGRFID